MDLIEQKQTEARALNEARQEPSQTIYPDRYIDIGNGTFYVPQQNAWWDRYLAVEAIDVSNGPADSASVIGYPGHAWKGGLGPIAGRLLAELSMPRLPTPEARLASAKENSIAELMTPGPAVFWPATLYVTPEGVAAGFGELDCVAFADEQSLINAMTALAAKLPPRRLQLMPSWVRDIANEFADWTPDAGSPH